MKIRNFRLLSGRGPRDVPNNAPRLQDRAERWIRCAASVEVKKDWWSGWKQKSAAYIHDGWVGPPYGLWFWMDTGREFDSEERRAMENAITACDIENWVAGGMQ